MSNMWIGTMNKPQTSHGTSRNISLTAREHYGQRSGTSATSRRINSLSVQRLQTSTLLESQRIAPGGSLIHSTKSGVGLMAITSPSTLIKELRSLHNSTDSLKMGSTRYLSAVTSPQESRMSVQEERSKLSKKELENLLDERERELVVKDQRIEKLEYFLQQRSNRSIMKSGMSEDQILMKMQISEEEDISKVKSLLLRQLTLIENNQRLLTYRCGKVKEIIDLFQVNVQADDMIFLKQNDIIKMNNLIKKLSDTLENTSRVEIEHGIKIRELDKTRHEFSLITKQHAHLRNRNQHLEQELKEYKETVTILEDLEKRNLKISILEKNKSEGMARRLDSLEKGILFLKQTEKGGRQMDITPKLKNILNNLMKENQELRKELRDRKGIITDREKEIGRLTSKITRLNSKIEEIKEKKRSQGKGQGKGVGGEDKKSIYESGGIMNREGFETCLDIWNNGKDVTRRSILYRTEILQTKYAHLLVDLAEYGSRAFAINTLEEVAIQEKRERIVFIADQLLVHKDLSERLNGLCSIMMSLTKMKEMKEIMMKFGSLVAPMFTTERAILWLYDEQSDEIWTIYEGRECRFSASVGIHGAAIHRNKCFIGGNIVKHECYSKEIDKEFVQQTSTMMLYPFKNKIGEIMGVIELGNSFIGAFGLDEEFMADSLCQFLSILAYKLASEKQFLSESWKIKDIQSACIKLYGEKDLFSITQIVQETINNIFGVKESVIVFLHPDQENIVIYDYLDRKRKELPKKTGLCGLSIEDNLAVEFVAPYDHPMYNSQVDLQTKLPLLCFPLHHKKEEGETQDAGNIEEEEEKPFGVIQFASKYNQTKAMKDAEYVSLDYAASSLVNDFGYFIAKLLVDLEI